MCCPFISPLRECQNDWRELSALLGKLVFLVSRPIARRDFVEDTALYQLIEPNGQRVLGDPERLLKVFEAARAQHRIADDKQGPPGPNQVQRTRNRALHV